MHLINEFPYPNHLYDSQMRNLKQELMLCSLSFTKVKHDDISSINQEIIINKTNSSQNLGTSPVNNLTKDTL